VKFTFSKKRADIKRTTGMYYRLLLAGLRAPRKSTIVKMGGIFVQTKVRAAFRFKVSSEFPYLVRKRYFCDEPWTGVFSVTTNLDVNFCPCYLKMKLGNLNESPIEEIWNAPQLVAIRSSFKKGKLPSVCQRQLCPVALSKDVLA